MTTKIFSKRVDSDLLDNVSELYASLGTSTQEAFVMFLRKSLEVQGLPFELRKKVDTTEFDENGVFISDIRLKEAVDYIRNQCVVHGRRGTLSELFDEEW